MLNDFLSDCAEIEPDRWVCYEAIVHHLKYMQAIEVWHKHDFIDYMQHVKGLASLVGKDEARKELLTEALIEYRAHTFCN